MDTALREDHPWHPSQVTEERLSKLASAIDEKIAELWKPDEDGDYPIQYDLTDRTRFSSAGYLPVPYIHNARTPEEKQRILNVLVNNLRRAADDLNTFLRLQRIETESSSELLGELAAILGLKTADRAAIVRAVKVAMGKTG